jgi:hypothetical protein
VVGSVGWLVGWWISKVVGLVGEVVGWLARSDGWMVGWSTGPVQLIVFWGLAVVGGG